MAQTMAMLLRAESIIIAVAVAVAVVAAAAAAAADSAALAAALFVPDRQRSQGCLIMLMIAVMRVMLTCLERGVAHLSRSVLMRMTRSRRFSAAKMMSCAHMNLL